MIDIFISGKGQAGRETPYTAKRGIHYIHTIPLHVVREMSSVCLKYLRSKFYFCHYRAKTCYIYNMYM